MLDTFQYFVTIEKIIFIGAAMKKYLCTVCGYEYDPEVEDPDEVLSQVLHLKVFLKIG